MSSLTHSFLVGMLDVSMESLHMVRHFDLQATRRTEFQKESKDKIGPWVLHATNLVDHLELPMDRAETGMGAGEAVEVNLDILAVRREELASLHNSGGGFGRPGFGRGARGFGAGALPS
ncbi:unnamed protein product [Cuscuta europaea]|uniref:Uncharacterized protein n=1 Tax=Cuscuta europaea TaxID=41803 RepID=A0A9P1E9A8_CUSEU|nr:unnamed protein product [Cuscuta europaea]